MNIPALAHNMEQGTRGGDRERNRERVEGQGTTRQGNRGCGQGEEESEDREEAERGLERGVKGRGLRVRREEAVEGSQTLSRAVLGGT